MEKQPFKFIELKQKNRRISIYVSQEESGELAFHVYTKRLESFQDRKIVQSNTIYGYHTFKLLSKMMNHVLEDTELKRITNRLDKYFQVEKANAKTNVKR